MSPAKRFSASPARSPYGKPWRAAARRPSRSWDAGCVPCSSTARRSGYLPSRTWPGRRLRWQRYGSFRPGEKRAEHFLADAPRRADEIVPGTGERKHGDVGPEDARPAGDVPPIEHHVGLVRMHGENPAVDGEAAMQPLEAVGDRAEPAVVQRKAVIGLERAVELPFAVQCARVVRAKRLRVVQERAVAPRSDRKIELDLAPFGHVPVEERAVQP